MQQDCLVVGAGFAGSTAARVLAEAGKRVLLIEEQETVAGHCHDYQDSNGITVHSYGPHIFHTNSKAAWSFVTRFARFNSYQHRVLSRIGDQFLPFPVNRGTINMLFDLSLTAGREVRAFLQEEVGRATYNDPPQNFRDVVVSQVGERLYETLFKAYTMKQWERDPEELDPSVARRIPIRFDDEDRYFTDTHQGVPLKGYTRLVEAILDHPNITLELGQDYFDSKKNVDAGLTVYTGPLDRFFDYKYGELQYRSLRLELKTADKEHHQPAAVVNYPDQRPWTRITEYKYFLSEVSKRTTICYEYPQSRGKPFYVVLTADNLNRRERYMEEVKTLDKVIFLGRLAEYQYYNMDQVIEAALRRVGALVS
ncbi:MAG TPA: UDP-galactopyranose mutase [bacterium]|nr:UDP-galactopyranose mutase [bacterium]